MGMSRNTSKSVAFRNRVKWPGAHLLVVSGFHPFFSKMSSKSSPEPLFISQIPRLLDHLALAFSLSFTAINAPKIG